MYSQEQEKAICTNMNTNITDFNQIMKIVNEMEGEEKEKYTRAVNSLIQTIESKVMNLK